MAGHTDVQNCLRRSDSLDFIPPDMSELTLVLLGNSSSLKASVGNLLLGKETFTQPVKRVKGSVTFKDKPVTVIVSAEELLTNTSKEHLQQHVQKINDLSSSGPRLFLLVLQSEDFTQDYNHRFQSVLKSFSEEAFNQGLVLLFRPQQHTPEFSETYMRKSQIQDLIRKCRYRHMWMDHTDLHDLKQKEFKQKQLFSRIGDMLKSSTQVQKSPEIHFKSKGLRIALIGKRGSGKRTTANTILGDKCLVPEAAQPKEGEKVSRQVQGRTVTVVNTPPLFEDSFSEELYNCISQLSQGPHAFLLLLPIRKINEEDRNSLQMIHESLGEKAIDYVMIVFTGGDELSENYTIENVIEECGDIVKDMLEKCKNRFHVIKNRNETNDGDRQVLELLQKIDLMVQENGAVTREIIKVNETQEELKQTKLKMEEVLEENKTLEEKNEEAKLKMKEVLKKTLEEQGEVKKKIEQMNDQIQELMKENRILEQMKKSLMVL